MSIVEKEDYLIESIYKEETEIGIKNHIFSNGRDLNKAKELLSDVRHFLWKLENDMCREPGKELISIMSGGNISIIALMQMINSFCIYPEDMKNRVNALLEDNLR